MVSKIEHVALFSNDTAALKDWYVKMFGFKVVYDNGKGTFFLSSPAGDLIEMCSCPTETAKEPQNQAGLRHLAFYVEDFEAAVNNLKAAQVDIVSDATTSDKGISTFFFRDIDGNILHLINRVNPL